MSPVLINEGLNIWLVNCITFSHDNEKWVWVLTGTRVYQVHQIALSIKCCQLFPRAHRELHFLTLLRLYVGLWLVLSNDVSRNRTCYFWVATLRARVWFSTPFPSTMVLATLLSGSSFYLGPRDRRRTPGWAMIDFCSSYGDVGMFVTIV